MPLPSEYLTASADFDRYIDAMRARTLTDSRNVHYTTTQAVFQVFRRRVSFQQALTLADALPPVLRAIFVADWNVEEPRALFADNATLIAEVQSLRPHHNFATDTAIADVVASVWSVVNRRDFTHALATLPADAAGFWSETK